MSLFQMLENTLSEHLKCYILLSYDYDGKHIIISKIDNQQELDALHNALARKELEFAENMNIDCEEFEEGDED